MARRRVPRAPLEARVRYDAATEEQGAGFERPRYEAAKAAFEAAFNKGYAAGLRDLEDGRAERDASVSSVFYLDIPEDDVLDEEYQQHMPRFEQAGRRVALATHRTGAAKLDHVLSNPDTHHHERPHDVLRWIVHLHPSP